MRAWSVSVPAKVTSFCSVSSVIWRVTWCSSSSPSRGWRSRCPGARGRRVAAAARGRRDGRSVRRPGRGAYGRPPPPVDAVGLPARRLARAVREPRAAPRAGERSRWTLEIAGVGRRTYTLRAALGTLRRPFRPAGITVDGRPLPRSRWRCDGAHQSPDRGLLGAAAGDRAGDRVARAGSARDWVGHQGAATDRSIPAAPRARSRAQGGVVGPPRSDAHGNHANAPTPVMSRPTISDWIVSVPSKVWMASMSAMWRITW
jgi:hypothetical protein